jgi:transcriptional regulator with XRE-family HTH domain
MTFGERLKSLRKERKLSQQELSDRIGINRATYARYETNDNQPDFDTLRKLAEFFEVTVDYLLTGRTDPNQESVQDPIPQEEREFLEWVKNNLEGTFFYDFSRAPEEQKRDMMKSLRIIWELEKHRKPGQKQGE